MLTDFDVRRLSAVARSAVERCALDLHGAVVVTEAATGPYVITPVLAALAGADVHAVGRSSRYGSFDEIRSQTLALAASVGVAARINLVHEKSADLLHRADIVANCGHLRPLDRTTIGWMRSSAVITLMYETWEFRGTDVDIHAAEEKGIVVAGTNERHPNVDVFSFLPFMAAKQLFDAGVAVYRSRLLVLCDNPFATYLIEGLTRLGADVTGASELADLDPTLAFDAIVVALHPRSGPVLSTDQVAEIARRWPAAVMCQYWGDLDREACRAAGIEVWPPTPPGLGHMGVLPSDIGPEPVARLQSGGLKVGEVLWRMRVDRVTDADLSYVQPLMPETLDIGQSAMARP